MLTLIESPELLVETVLGFDSDSDDGRGLPLSASFEDKLGADSVSVVPGGFDQETSGMDVTGFGDGSSSFFLTGGAFRGDESKVGHQSPWGSEAPDVVDFAQKHQSSEYLDATQSAEGFDLFSELM